MRTEADEFQAHIEQGDLLSSHPTKGPELEAAFEKQEEVQHDDSEMQLKRKRRRDEWERNKTERRLWELHRNLGNLVRRADDLISESKALQGKIQVPLPPYDVLPETEKERLAVAHKKRLSDMLSTVCKKILQGIMTNKWSWPFNAPVDINVYVDYMEKVKTPMDFGTIKKKLDTGKYSHPEQFIQDVRLVFDNARTYNKPGSDVHVMACTLQEKFEDRCAASITPRVVEELKVTDAEAIDARRKISEVEELKKREQIDAECAALIQAIDSLVSDIDIEKIKAAAQCAPVDRKTKEELCQKLSELSEEDFGRVLGIVMHHYPGLHLTQEVAFDIETLDALCLRQIMDYMAFVQRRNADGKVDKNDWPPRIMLKSTKKKRPAVKMA